MNVQYTLIGSDDGERNLVVFVPGIKPQVAHESHPNFDQILSIVVQDEMDAWGMTYDEAEHLIGLFDIAATAAQKFQRLSERVTTANGRLYLDSVEIDNALTEQVLRFLSEGVEDWKPLVAFFENVQANPNEHSREQLYNWLSKRDFTITRNGDIVGYKGVRTTATGFESIHSGKAIVNGEVKTGNIPNNYGDVVEMPRSEVQWDPSVGCHTGLHVGTYEYARSFGNGNLLEVHVNPRDVVSVPTDSDWAKVRCCRYTVIASITEPYSAPVLDYDDEDYDDDDLWGDGEDF
jgi:hypothetical protein